MIKSNDYYSQKNIAERYKNYLTSLANIQAQIRDMRDDFKAVTDKLEDAGDPYMDADEVLIHFSSLLADLITYQSEYEADGNNDPK